MVATPLEVQPTPTIYPSSDGEPVAETFVHLYAMLVTIEVLKQYLEGQQATVLGNQFMYYAQGFPRLRVAPDVMVIFGVAPGGRDNYKIWEEGEVPAIVFEMTSAGTRAKDETFKKMLYAQLGVQEYWLFDPKGEWLDAPLQGYRLHGEEYEPIIDSLSTVLKLRLEHEGSLIGFYREDSGERLLIPSELSMALNQEALARQQAEQRAEQESQRAEQERQRAEQERQRADRLAEKLKELGIDPNNLM